MPSGNLDDVRRKTSLISLFALVGASLIIFAGFSFDTILLVLLAFVVIYLIAGLQIINQYERGVVLTLGRYSGLKEPGLNWILLGFQRIIKVDIRIKVIDVPNQDCMTKDNVSVNVSAVIYYYLSAADKAVLEVEHFGYAVSQLAQTTMRDVIGAVTLDELLGQRDEISRRIQEIVDSITDAWGVKVNSVDLKHIELPGDMKRTMGKEAEAERERRAVIIQSEGEKIAAENLAHAANILATSPGALHLRTLHSINDISSDQSNTVIFAIPLEVLRAIEGFSKQGHPSH